MTITYKVGDGLYVNMTNKCTNACDFCIRNNGEGAYGSDPLWLEREPTREEVLEDILRAFSEENYSELVFCGYGEPTCRLEDMLWVCRGVRASLPHVKIRLNTNGQADLICGKDTAAMFEGLIDSISISLNSADAKKYQDVCHSVYGEEAYSAMLTFAHNVAKYVPDVAFSVVRGFLPEEDIPACQAIADNAGVRLRVREYIS